MSRKSITSSIEYRISYSTSSSSLLLERLLSVELVLKPLPLNPIEIERLCFLLMRSRGEELKREP